MGHNVRHDHGSHRSCPASPRGPHDSNLTQTMSTFPEKRPKMEEKKPACAETYLEHKYPINPPVVKRLYTHTQRTPFNLSSDYPTQVQSNVFNGQAGNWSLCGEGMYTPPYEMIWARHLGLTAPESSFAFASHQPSNKDLLHPKHFLCQTRLGALTSPRKDVVPIVITDSKAKAGSEDKQPANSAHSGFKLYRPFENVIEKPHYSAFKPVITSPNIVSPIDFSNKNNVADYNNYVRTRILEEEQETDTEGHDNNPTPQQNISSRSGPSSVSSVSSEHKETDTDDVLDVDTIDEQQEDQNDSSKSEDNSVNSDGETLPEMKEKCSSVFHKITAKVNEESNEETKQKYFCENNAFIGNTAHSKDLYTHIREEGNRDPSHSDDDVSTSKSIADHSIDNKENIG